MRRRTRSSAPPPAGGWIRVPFVGRTAELTRLREELAIAPAVVIHGALGAGKSRLVRQLISQLTAPSVIVRCAPGDTAGALRARAERALRCPAGGLGAALAEAARVIVLDDVHHLSDADLGRLLPTLVPGPTALGRLVVVAREPVPVGRGSGAAELELGGLDDLAARELWQILEDTWGPATQGAFDAGLTKTRGMPLALRREYARAVVGADAWNLAALPAPARAALEALSVLRWPAAISGLAALTGDTDGKMSLVELARRQLIDLDEGDRFVVHDVVHTEVIAALAADRREELERKASALVAGTGRGTGGARPAWDAGDDGALAVMDPVDRLREVVRHELGAGARDRAATALIAGRDVAARRGAGGELEALIAAITDGDPVGDRSMTRGADGPAVNGKSDPAAARLNDLRVELALRAGRIAHAAELAAGHTVDPALVAELALAAGDIDRAQRALMHLAAPHAQAQPVATDRVRAAAVAVELALLRGNVEDAEAAHADAMSRVQSSDDRIAVGLMEARIAEHGGAIDRARAALGRGGGAGADAVPNELAVRIHARRAACLAREGRVTEAGAALDSGDAIARDLDAMPVIDELRLARAQVAIRRGDTEAAVTALRELVASRRAFGDEIGALRAEVELAELLAARGEMALAAELASAAHATASRRRLDHLTARAGVVLAWIDLAEVRVDAARDALERLVGGGALDAASAARAEALLAEARALSGQRTAAIAAARDAGGDQVRDDIDRDLAVATVAVAAGDIASGLETARSVAVRAERLGRAGDLASALGLVARLELARGDHTGARAAATRAVREATRSGIVRVRVHALLALAALSRDDGDHGAALAYARDAAEMATAAGLPVERLAAYAALDGIAGADVVADPSSPSAATMAAPAIEAAARLLADLGLTAQRPFRVIDADGATSDVADANPEILRLPARSLAVDGVRETIWRQGQELADLRRRSLLKRLLFLFAAAPGKVFSKEDIVQTVWNVEYHPLRHDAALFTNIMRIRRLLGEDGAEIIRVTEDGYRFVPPRDYVFVSPR
jgi:tetratricopeptide (TPR) repeat protein